MRARFSVRMNRKVSSTDESSAERLAVYYLNGVLKEEKAFKTQYQNVIGIMMDYEIEPGEELQYDKNDKVTITYHYTNGETRESRVLPFE